MAETKYYLLVKEIPSWGGIPNNEIWYTSSDRNVVTPYTTDVFGAKIYSDGKVL